MAWPKDSLQDDQRSPPWSLKIFGELCSLTPYLSPIFMARLCQPPYACSSISLLNTILVIPPSPNRRIFYIPRKKMFFRNLCCPPRRDGVRACPTHDDPGFRHGTEHGS